MILHAHLFITVHLFYTQSRIYMSIAPDCSRVSIREHTSVRSTDQLYDPLRQTFLNPQNIQRHAALTPVVARSSFLTKEYKLLSPEELQRMEQNIYIPNASLYPTNNLAPVRNEKFVAVDASERIIGAPITPEELERIRSQGVRKQEVLYELKPDGAVAGNAEIANSRSVNMGYSAHKSQKVQASPAPPPLQPVQEQVVYEYAPMAERYTVQNYDNYGKHEEEYKYNLFSIVDEPFNKCRELGMQGCASCPSNEVIASRNRQQSLNIN